MKDTKNGAQKNSDIKQAHAIRTDGGKKLSYFSESISKYRIVHKDDISRLSVLVLFGLISALLIQETVGISHFIGSFLVASIILFVFYKDIKRYKPGYLENYKMLLLLGILVTGTLLIGRIFAYLLEGLNIGLALPDGTSYIFGIPLPLGAMLVTLIFDFHTAIIFSFALSLISGIWLDNPFYPVYTFIGSLTAAFSVIRCKRRSALIKGGLYVSCVNMITAGVVLLLAENLFSEAALSAFLFAAISGILVASIVSVLLPAIESIFGITTDISLVELLDLDQPLMRNLMISAPGTYHHSVIVGNLAEAAAEAVGANPLLARVTAYYHDIGKIKMPEYFVENQPSTVNKHEKLTPHMSSMILTSHVREGVDLARHYKLPKLVVDIIHQHHGTSLITYFYQKALEQSLDTQQENYRYPGPKPQTRVAAIVMMADAVEAASRALTNPTPARISDLVEKIINSIFLDGQIEECELTLKDISEIKKRFTLILTGIFHKRIEYPDIRLKSAKRKDVISHGDNDTESSKTSEDKSSENRKGDKEGYQASN